MSELGIDLGSLSLILPPLLQACTSSSKGSGSERIADRCLQAVRMCQVPKTASLKARTAWRGASYEGPAASSWLRGKVGAGSTGRPRRGAGAGLVGQAAESWCVNKSLIFLTHFQLVLNPMPSHILRRVLPSLWACKKGEGEIFQMTFPYF